jgi:hypothetical protein
MNEVAQKMIKEEKNKERRIYGLEIYIIKKRMPSTTRASESRDQEFVFFY